MERRFDNNDSDSSYSRRDSYDRNDSARREGSREGSSRFTRSYNREGDSYGSRPRVSRYNSESTDSERPRFSRPRYSDENEGEQRPRFTRPRYNSESSDSERPRFNSRPRYNSESGDSERPRFNSRPRYNSESGDSERPRFNSRPRYNSESGESERPRFNSRPRYNSESSEDERPRYNSRPRYNQDSEGEQKPRFNSRDNNRGGSFRKSDGQKPRPNGRDNKRGGFKKENRGYSESRPRFSKEHGFHNYNRDEMPQRSSITDELFVENEAAELSEAVTSLSDKMRLNRYIAMAGVCSRREADELIKNGQIKVNGQVITEMGVTVQKTDVVEFEGRVLQAERKVYVLLNKPKDVITTTDDPEERKTILDLVEGACEERIYPVGRLDRNTTGVILLTNDGELTEKLMHPKFGVRKIYHAFLDKNVTDEDMRKMIEGLTLDDGPIAVDDVRYVDGQDKKQVGVQIHSGRNRIVRRIFEHLGYNVERLDRVYFAGLTKLNLPRGRWRFLTDAEINKLKAGFFK